MIKLGKLAVEKTKIVIANLLCDFVDGEIRIRQIKAGLAHFLKVRPVSFLMKALR